MKWVKNEKICSKCIVIDRIKLVYRKVDLMMRSEEKIKTINNNRYNSIDGLRAISAIGIVLMHVMFNSKSNTGIAALDTFIGQFGACTLMFMIISAFSMCCGYYDKISNATISISAFYEKRYLRVLPFFALIVCVDVIMSPSISSLIEAFADITLCFALLPNPNISVIGVGWTLGVIFVFYMLFPFFCFALKNKKRAWLSMIVTVIFNIFCLLYFFDEKHIASDAFNARGNIVYCSMFFTAGGLIYLYRDKLVRLVSKFRWLVLLACVGVTALYFILLKISLLNNVVCSLIYLVMFSLWLIYAIGADDKLLNNRVTRFLSSISFEIYLCHMMIYRLLEKLHLVDLFGKRGGASYFLISALTLGGAIVFSFVAKKVIDYAINYIKTKRSKKASV